MDAPPFFIAYAIKKEGMHGFAVYSVRTKIHGMDFCAQIKSAAR